MIQIDRENHGLGQLIAQTILQELGRFETLRAIARADANIEGVHQLRVCVRRLRAILTECSSLIVKNPSDLLEELRVLGRTLGAVRDLDVLQVKVSQWGLEVPLEPQVLEIVQAVLETSRLKARSELFKSLDSPRTQHLFKYLNELAQTIPGQFMPNHDQQKIEKVLEAAYQHLQQLAIKTQQSHATLESLHALRKQTKRLRYVLEMLEPLIGSAAGKAIKQMKAWQSQLGELNDLAFGLEHLHDLARERFDLAFVLEPLEQYVEENLRTTRAQFLSEFKTFDARAKWQTLRRGLKHHTKLEHAK
jgi:CHAD domain-containing protein